MRQTGNAAFQPKTLSEVFVETAIKMPERPAIYVERGGKELKWTWKDYSREAFAFAKAMHTLGINERKSVNIMGHNAPEWTISFMGSIVYNCIASGVYPTNNADACLY